MAAHLDTIATELGQLGAGLDRSVSKVTEADQYVQRSIEAATRGGFTAMIGNLRAAQDQLRQVRGMLVTARSDLGQAAASVASAPKEIKAQQVVAIVSPLLPQVDKVRGTLRAVGGQIPQVVQRIAASADQSPALPILTEVNQQVIAPVIQRLDAVHQTAGAALAEAKAAQASGG